MTPGASGPDVVGFRRSGRRLVAHRLQTRADAGRESGPALLGAPGAFLVDVEAAPSSGTIYAESAVLTALSDTPEWRRGSRLMARRPPLIIGDPVGAGRWTPVPDEVGTSLALWLPLTSDVMESLARMEFPPGTRVAHRSSRLPDGLSGACIEALGGIPLGLNHAGLDSDVESRPTHLLLDGLDAVDIAQALSRTADRAVVVILAPRADERTFDFYRDVHRRSLTVLHGGPGHLEFSDAARSLLGSGRLDLAPQPAARIKLQAMGQGEVGIDLPARSTHMVLEIEP